MPKIQDLLLRLEGFHPGTILDLNMGYYHMNSRSNKNSINSSILRLKRKLTAPRGAHQHFLHRRRDEHQKCFDATKCMLRREVLKGYPDFNAPFEIHTDASKLKLGAVISQKGKPIPFYSRICR